MPSYKSTTVPSLSSLDPHFFLHNHFPAHSFSLPNTRHIFTYTRAGDRSSPRGTCANASLVAAQLLRIRESWPQEIWARTGRVQLASAFLGSLIAGKWMSMNEAEACATGIWVHDANPNVVSSPGQGNMQGSAGDALEISQDTL
jgi:xylulokinase